MTGKVQPLRQIETAIGVYRESRTAAANRYGCFDTSQIVFQLCAPNLDLECIEAYVLIGQKFIPQTMLTTRRIVVSTGGVYRGFRFGERMTKNICDQTIGGNLGQLG